MLYVTTNYYVFLILGLVSAYLFIVCLFTYLYNAVITIAIRLRYDYDPTTTYRTRLLPFDAI